MGKLFGTDGVRGIANSELTAELSFRIGQAGAIVLSARSGHRPVILVGMDTRISGHMIECALISGICSVGAEAISLGVAPTPAIAYLTRLYGADAGVVISASHNPYEFNGIKFFNGNGYKLPDLLEDQIEEILYEDRRHLSVPTGKDVGTRTFKDTAVEDYSKFIAGLARFRLDGYRIALDCANGASYKVAPKMFRDLGADVQVINDEPDGTNINKKCGSTYISKLQDFVRDCGADAGFAFDGDADRVLAVDENGRLIDGDILMAITGTYLKRNGMLASNTIVATVMSNIGLDIMAEREGMKIVKTKVGDRYVLEEMLDKGYNFGGEQSGHIIFLDKGTTGDGLLTAVQIAEIVQDSKQKLSELAKVMEVFPQVLKNARVSNGKKFKYLEDEVIAGICSDLENEFRGEGRVLIRPSGTEPLVRVMIEGRDLKLISEKAGWLVKIIEQRLGD